MKLMIFSGTTEGHDLCRFLSKNSVQADVFVATEYGAAVMEPMAGITVHEGRLDEREMEKRLTSDTLLIDATHPYAAAVTDNLRAACAKSGARYERLLRPALPYQNCEIVLNTAAAVDWLNAHEGAVLLTTGSKELEAYTAVQDFQTRLFPRVLPTASVLEKCAALGFPGAHIIAMQGPFSQAMNAALLRETGAKILVTKDTGVSGGFAEKVAAAEEVGAKVLVIARPRVENGKNQAQMQRISHGFAWLTAGKSAAHIHHHRCRHGHGGHADRRSGSRVGNGGGGVRDKTAGGTVAQGGGLRVLRAG